ncbi:DUF4245 domain-containing protein [Nocardioides sp. cx-169]|uniref:DUF4245 family protein n=1 Tax=Nocardioides sp. cx-169 TaxID=2899080 RepID=UPI001E534088|nr:DUF4245 family protein [Nocardioides sp. cx-169]MCD4536114.1 DUF4245 domain-containing protein [Nocardioides sp. cx-169]
MSDSEKPGRYPRSANSLIASLVVTLLVVAAFVVFRAVTRDNKEIEPEAVDYLETVEQIQGSGARVAYPPELPQDWKVTGVAFTPGERGAFGLSMLTDDGTFVGLRQEDEGLDDLLATYVDEETVEGEPVTFDSPIATTWESYSDEGGDRAYATELGEDTLLVFGSADEDDQRLLIESLTTEPVS